MLPLTFGGFHVTAKCYNRFSHLNPFIGLEVTEHLLHLLVYCKNKSK